MNLVRLTVNRDPGLSNELTNKKDVIDLLPEGTLVRFIQTLEIYLMVSVGNDICSLTKNNKIQIFDTTVLKSGNTEQGVLPYWKIICNDKNNN